MFAQRHQEVNGAAYGIPPWPQMMAVQAHMGAVKCVASGGGYIASGGADDLIRRAHDACAALAGCECAAKRRM